MSTVCCPRPRVPAGEPGDGTYVNAIRAWQSSSDEWLRCAVTRKYRQDRLGGGPKAVLGWRSGVVLQKGQDGARAWWVVGRDAWKLRQDGTRCTGIAVEAGGSLSIKSGNTDGVT